MANSIRSALEKEYDQPDFYHFNEDSIHLVHFIRKEMTFNRNDHLCEFGAGCGVISYELARAECYHKIVLLEVQQEFSPFLISNRNRFKLEKLEIKIRDVCSFVSTTKFDCIYFNPPYFFKESSRMSGDPHRDRCRRIEEKDLLSWFEKAKSLLTEGGHLFFSFRGDIEVPLKLITEERQSGCTLFHYQNESSFWI